MKTLILASQSPRRKELLERCGIPFETMPADINESIDTDQQLEKEIERLSYEKAKHIFSLRPDAVVIGSDTIVAVDGKPLGKPHDRQTAEHMLKSIQGRSHHVITGLAILSAKRTYMTHETAEVTFASMDEAEIVRYIDTGECFDKAGAYGIQGYGGRYISQIHGDYYAIMGLPLHLVYAELKRRQII